LNFFVDDKVIEKAVSTLYYRLTIKDAFDQTRTVKHARLKLDQATSLGINAYPNPATDWMRLQYLSAQGESLKLRIMSATGQTLLQKEIAIDGRPDGNLKLDVSGWATGIYFVQVLDEQSNRVLRMLIQ
ncbi:MAG: T9SS type A sorting domain-containing protein, partial [Bacteroidota bacterium]